MNEFRLSFCKLVIISDIITETIVDDKIEINNAMIREYHNWLAKQHDGDFGILINKVNHYSYSFDAQLEIGTIDRIKAIAVVVPDKSREIAAETILNSIIRKNIPHRIFYDRNEAINWLNQTLNV